MNLRDYPTLQAGGRLRAHEPAGFGGRGEGRGARGDSRAPLLRQSPDLQSPISNLQSPAADPVADKVLDVVADKTGYPKDMLELDLDLEADLGIDTVKQAETFATIRETFDIPVQEGLNLRDYPTLQAAWSASSARCGRIWRGRGARGEGRRRCSARCASRSVAQSPNLQSPISSRRPRRGEGAGGRRRQDRLPDRDARTRPGHGGRPGHRHGQAGRDLRQHPRDRSTFRCRKA